MKKCLLGLLVVVLLTAADRIRPADDQAKVQGTWIIVAMEHGGKKASEDSFKGQSLIFEGNKVTSKRQQDSKTGTFKLDATQKPPHFDFTSENGQDTLKMLYLLDRDTLKLYGDKSEKGDRPKSYETAATIITLKREQK